MTASDGQGSWRRSGSEGPRWVRLCSLEQAITRHLNNERLDNLRISISMDIKMWVGLDEQCMYFAHPT